MATRTHHEERGPHARRVRQVLEGNPRQARCAVAEKQGVRTYRQVGLPGLLFILMPSPPFPLFPFCFGCLAFALLTPHLPPDSYAALWGSRQ